MSDAETEAIDRPKRWKIPYAEELFGSRMSYQEVRVLLRGPLRHLAEDRKRFPPDLPLQEILRYDTRIREYQEDEVIISEGEYGDSAYFILAGRVNLVLPRLPNQKGRKDRFAGPARLLRTAARLFQNRSRFPEVRGSIRRPDAEKKSGQHVHLQDYPDFLLPDGSGEFDPSVIHKLPEGGGHEGNLFGEFAALSRMPRTATVISGGAKILEIRWQGLRDICKYSPQWKEKIDERYRSSSLNSQLRRTQYTQNLLVKDKATGRTKVGPDFEKLVKHTHFRSYGEFTWKSTFKEMAQAGDRELRESEPLILKQGSIAAELIIIRSGFIRLTRRYNHGEKTVAYLGKGQTYGMVELYHNSKLDQHDFSIHSINYAHSLRAIGHVDVMTIPAPVVQELIIPKLRKEETQELDSLFRKLMAETETEAEDNASMMEFLVKERAINGRAAMMIDLDRCTRCDDCVRACAATHDNNPRFIRSGPAEQGIQLTHACMHCVDPVCMIGCPTGAIHRDAIGEQVLINEYTCIGCSTCADNCPYDNIQMVELRESTGDFLSGTEMTKDLGRVRKDPTVDPLLKATKCDLCESLPTGPACANACPHDALIRADLTKPDTFFEWLNRH